MFEPCGLSQLISLRYGTLPIVRETGGLRDTVLAYNEFTGEGNGFSFFNYNAHDMLYVIEHAVKMYKEDRPLFEKLAKRAMSGEYGWDKSAAKYIALYEKLTGVENDVPIEAQAEPVKKAPAKKTTKKAEPKAAKTKAADAAPAKKTRKSKAEADK